MTTLRDDASRGSDLVALLISVILFAVAAAIGYFTDVSFGWKLISCVPGALVFVAIMSRSRGETWRAAIIDAGVFAVCFTSGWVLLLTSQRSFWIGLPIGAGVLGAVIPWIRKSLVRRWQGWSRDSDGASSLGHSNRNHDSA